MLVFDEDYYVNAARVMASIKLAPGTRYAGAPRGSDPNSEHPQLAKLVIAGSIELFGDGPLAWRLGSLLCGTLALLGMFVLVRAAGGGPWLALGAAALMAADNLQLVHGRIGTLDVYALSAMIWAAVAYLRGHPLLAGVLVAVGACAKLVAPYVLVAFVLYELLRRADARRALRSLGICLASAGACVIALLALLDRVAAPYDDGTKRMLPNGPLHHLAHMLSFAARQRSPHGPKGIASYPWEWLGDYKPIVYLNIDPSHPSAGLRGIHPAVHFLGMISPPILLVALLGMAIAARHVRSATSISLLGLAWTVGTLLPFLALSLFWQRTSYLYYMVVVMPGLYLLAADFASRWRRRWSMTGWALAIAIALVAMYPFTPVPGG